MKLKEELLRGIYCYGKVVDSQDSTNPLLCSSAPSSPSFLEEMSSFRVSRALEKNAVFYLGSLQRIEVGVHAPQVLVLSSVR